MMAVETYPNFVRICVLSNLNTRLVVIPLRSETVGDVRETIKEYHMQVFPEHGRICIIRVKVRFSDVDEDYALTDNIVIGNLFRSLDGFIVIDVVQCDLNPCEKCLNKSQKLQLVEVEPGARANIEGTSGARKRSKIANILDKSPKQALRDCDKEALGKVWESIKQSNIKMVDFQKKREGKRLAESSQLLLEM